VDKEEIKPLVISQAWQYTPVILVIGSLKQEGLEFEANLGYKASSKAAWTT
jgi:hypothetical protein